MKVLTTAEVDELDALGAERPYQEHLSNLCYTVREARAAIQDAILALYGPDFTPQNPEDFPTLARWRRALGETA